MKIMYKIGQQVTINTQTAPTKTGKYLMTATIEDIKGNSITTDQCEPYFGYNKFSIFDIIKTAFLISPVKNLTQEELKEIESFIKTSDYKVHFPYKDTVQDTSEINICKQNLNAIKKSDIILIYFKPDSMGSIFDLGMCFALNKEIILINDVNKTTVKSFNNLILQLAL